MGGVGAPIASAMGWQGPGEESWRAGVAARDQAAKPSPANQGHGRGGIGLGSNLIGRNGAARTYLTELRTSGYRDPVRLQIVTATQRFGNEEAMPRPWFRSAHSARHGHSTILTIVFPARSNPDIALNSENRRLDASRLRPMDATLA